MSAAMDKPTQHGAGRRPPRRRLATLALLAALATAPTPAPACAGVRIETQAPLHFGLLRLQRASAGWVVLMPGGGVSHSPGVAFSERMPPAPGLIKVQAPPGSLLLLRLEADGNGGRTGAADAAGIALRAAVLGHGMQLLPRNGELWELQMPRRDADTVEIVLAVGGELHFPATDRPRSHAARLQVECVSVTADPAP